jgi:hypothetical protein
MKNLNSEQFAYHLTNNDGSYERINLPHVSSIKTEFVFQDKSYFVYDSDAESKQLWCREMPNLFSTGKYHPKQFEPELLKYEDQLINFFKKRGVSILPGDLNEKLFEELILNELEEYFEIERQVSCKHFSGSTLRIDAVLTPKDNSLWRNKNLTIGIEIKNPLTYQNSKRKKDEFLAQCLDYTQSEFKDYSDMIVLLCPLIPSFQNRFDTWRFLGSYNIGYLDFKDDSISMRIKNQEFWNENYLPALIKNSEFKQEYGNRS